MNDSTNQDRALGESIKRVQTVEHEGKRNRALRRAITNVLIDHDANDPDIAAQEIMALIRSAR